VESKAHGQGACGQTICLAVARAGS
jgi:hypothetical protein